MLAKKLLLSFFLIALNLFFVNIAFAASYTDHTIITSINQTISDSGDYNSYYEEKGFSLSSELISDTAITYIKFRIKFNGSDADSDENPRIDVYLQDRFGGSNNATPLGAPSSPALLASRTRQNSVQGQWYSHECTFDPDSGEQIGNRNIGLFIAGYDSYDYCSFSVEIQEIRYRKYTMDMSISLTPERYVKITLGRYTPNIYTSLRVRCINDGRYFVGGSTHFGQINSGSEYVIYDSNVTPEKVFNYSVEWKVGRSDLTGAISGGMSIKIPSDATYALSNTEYIISKMISSDAINSLQTSINNISTAVTSIQSNIGADITPPMVSLSTFSGARATSGNSIQLVVDASDNISTSFTYSLDGTNFSPLPVDGALIVPVNAPGSNLINVWIKDGAGNVSKKSIAIRKL